MCYWIFPKKIIRLMYCDTITRLNFVHNIILLFLPFVSRIMILGYESILFDF